MNPTKSPPIKNSTSLAIDNAVGLICGGWHTGCLGGGVGQAVSNSQGEIAPSAHRV
jgi:hypothetical protein